MGGLHVFCRVRMSVCGPHLDRIPMLHPRRFPSIALTALLSVCFSEQEGEEELTRMTPSQR
jgi:hypothetical protein